MVWCFNLCTRRVFLNSKWRTNNLQIIVQILTIWLPDPLHGIHVFIYNTTSATVLKSAMHVQALWLQLQMHWWCTQNKALFKRWSHKGVCCVLTPLTAVFFQTRTVWRITPLTGKVFLKWYPPWKFEWTCPTKWSSWGLTEPRGWNHKQIGENFQGCWENGGRLVTKVSLLGSLRFDQLVSTRDRQFHKRCVLRWSMAFSSICHWHCFMWLNTLHSCIACGTGVTTICSSLVYNG